MYYFEDNGIKHKLLARNFSLFDSRG